ncbi:MAG: hypothetical protein KBS52_05160 [Clostridiales bacterium]|nr:hypothetical protein [Candidatus Equinaster intestinalis]
MQKNSDSYIKGLPFSVPEKLISEKDYREKMDSFAAMPPYSDAEDDFLSALDEFTAQAKDMIYYHSAPAVFSGTAYYVSNDGDDNADGTSPETAWKTYKNPNEMAFKEGDAVLFRRGDVFRGMLCAKNGVTYSAYGSGPKPKLMAAYDGLTVSKWIKTEKENVWVLEEPFTDKDIGSIEFNCGQTYAKKKLKPEDLKQNLDFFYCTDFSWARPEGTEVNTDNRLYMYFDKGNPADYFDDIEINMCSRIITSDTGSKNITYYNLELLYGTSPIWTYDSENIVISYCVCGWSGGILWRKAMEGRNTRYGGGVCTWHGCNNISFDHCYIYEQFDSGVTPQYHWRDETSAIYNDYKCTDCIFEGCEWTFEYFNTQTNKKDNCFNRVIFSYNLCRKGGEGYGDKTEESAYVKSWGHENVCYDCEISHNVFDRAAAISLEVIAHAPEKRGKIVSYEHLPKMHHNTYIEPYGKQFANINGVFYKFNESSRIALQTFGVDTESVYLFIR